jgi:hypothetical protein
MDEEYSCWNTFGASKTFPQRASATVGFPALFASRVVHNCRAETATSVRLSTLDTCSSESAGSQRHDSTNCKLLSSQMPSNAG